MSHRNVLLSKYTPSYTRLCKIINCKSSKNSSITCTYCQILKTFHSHNNFHGTIHKFIISRPTLFQTFYHSVCIYVHTYMYKTKMKERDVWPLLLMHRLLYAAVIQGKVTMNNRWFEPGQTGKGFLKKWHVSRREKSV